MRCNMASTDETPTLFTPGTKYVCGLNLMMRRFGVTSIELCACWAGEDGGFWGLSACSEASGHKHTAEITIAVKKRFIKHRKNQYSMRLNE